MDMELIKENIEYEQLLGEETADTLINEECVIPDTQPDVEEILMLKTEPYVTNKEVMQDKVYVQGQMRCTVFYMAKDNDNSEVYSVIYTKEFSCYVAINGIQPDMNCEDECYIEHMECNVVNERKIVVEGILKVKCRVYKKCQYEIIKDVECSDNIQLLKNNVSVDKMVGCVSGDLIAKSHMQVSMDKPEIGKILDCNLTLHKKNVNIYEEKVEMEAMVHVEILYKAVGTKEIYYLDDDVLINKELECEGVSPFMDYEYDFKLEDVEYDIKEDDLGENRIIDVESLVKCFAKIFCKEELEVIEDAYLPSMNINVEKKTYELNLMLDHNSCETIVKENISLDRNIPAPSSILMSSSNVCITDKKIVEDKVVVEGILDVKVIYKTEDEMKYLGIAKEEIPFSCAVDIPEAKIDMQCMVKPYLESIEGDIEANTIAIKAIVKVQAKVNYNVNKKFLVSLECVEGEITEKKASITIYVVQSGDTLWKIAKRYCTTLESLLKVNEFDSEDNLTIGQKLIIPGRAII